MSRMTEQVNPASKGIDEKTVREILEIINAEDAKIAPAINLELENIGHAVEAIVETIKKDGRVFIVGAGTSGRLGIIEASEIPPTYGLSPDRIQGVIAGGSKAIQKSVEAAEDDRERGIEELQRLDLSQNDLVIGVTASGSTPFVFGAVDRAREVGAKTVGVSCNMASKLSRIVDIPVEVVVGPEVVAGSTRMKSGTTQKMVLNMMTTAAMIKLGLVHDGYMVGVQATNSKLRERSTKIVTEITGLPAEEARKHLDASDFDVRVAVLTALTGISVEEARKTLKEWRSLRSILKEEGAG